MKNYERCLRVYVNSMIICSSLKDIDKFEKYKGKFLDLLEIMQTESYRIKDKERFAEILMRFDLAINKSHEDVFVWLERCTSAKTEKAYLNCLVEAKKIIDKYERFREFLEIRKSIEDKLQEVYLNARNRGFDNITGEREPSVKTH